MLLSNFDLLAAAPGGVARLRELILTLAVQGKLVAQDAADEPASKLLKRVGQNALSSIKKSLERVDTVGPTIAQYDLPITWKWARLGDLVEQMGSGWSPACNEGRRTDPSRWAVLKTTAVQVAEYRPQEHKALPLNLSPRPDIEVKDGDILITRAGPMNRVGISCWVNRPPERLMLSDKIVRFHSIGNEMVPAFIVLALNAGWTKDQIEVAKTGMAASQVNISQSDIRNLWIPVCSVAEQARIVSRVEELMRVCDELEAKGQAEDTYHRQLVITLLGTLTDSASHQALTERWQLIAEHFDNLLDRPEAVDVLEKTILQLAVHGLLVPQDPDDEPAGEMLLKIKVTKERLIAEGSIRPEKISTASGIVSPFTLPPNWEWARLCDVTQITGGITLGRKTPVLKPVLYPYLRVANVQRGQLNLSVMKEVLIGQAELSRFEVRAGDLLITEGGDWDKVGRTAMWRNELQTCLHQNHVFKARGVSDKWNPLWAEHYLNSATARAYFASAAKQTTNLASINMTQLKACLIPMPPLAEQIRIVTRVEELRRLCANLRTGLNTQQLLKIRSAKALIDALA